MVKKKVKIKGHVTGIEQIDRECLGLKDGDLYCLCCSEHVDHANLLAKIIITELRKSDCPLNEYTIDPRLKVPLPKETPAKKSHKKTQKKSSQTKKNQKK